MYCILLRNLQNKPEFLNGTWIRLGGYYNLLLANLAIIGSYVIIFFAESTLDLVLNALALFFICQLDDILVRKYDYFKISYYIDWYKEQNDQISGDDEVIRYKDELNNHCLVCLEDCGCFGLETLLMFIKLFIPFYIGLCS